MTKHTNNPESTATEISSSASLRTMANPTRLRILGILRVEGAQTVGYISQRTGDAPGSVSYHLSQLYSAGLVVKEESPDGDKRKSWWKAKDSATRPAQPTDGPDDEVTDATSLFQRMAALTYERTYERYLDALPGLSRDWADAAMCSDRVLSLTSTELEEMNDELDAVVERWSERSANQPNTAGDRDEDNRRQHVAVIMQTFRWIP